MNLKERLTIERRWNKRAILINFYHNTMLMRNNKWSIRKTAKRLSISLGAASEAIKLSNAILKNGELEMCKTRKEALSKIK